MRIAVFATFYHPHVGGYEKNVNELVTRLVARGYIIDVITCNTNQSSLIEHHDNLTIFRVPCWSLLGGTYPVPKPSFRFFGQFWRRHYDCVSTQTRFFSLTMLGLVFAWLKHIPVIHTERGTRHSIVNNRWVNLVSQSVDHCMGFLINRYADCSVGVSDAACEFMEHIGIALSLRIPNGVDIPLECWSGNGKSSRVVCFVGRLIQAKGVQDLICVWNKIWEQFPNSSLVVVGDGAYRKKLERQACALPCIEFVGEKTPAEVKSILLKSSVFVNPSYSEGLPTSVMEAAAIGLPIVATDVGGTYELIENGRSGWIVHPGDRDGLCTSLLSLLGNDKLAVRFGEEARRGMALYSWDAIVDQYERLFRSVR